MHSLAAGSALGSHSSHLKRVNSSSSKSVAAAALRPHAASASATGSNLSILPTLLLPPQQQCSSHSQPTCSSRSRYRGHSQPTCSSSRCRRAQTTTPRAAAAAAAAAATTTTTAPAGLRVLYPQLSPHDIGYLRVSNLHTLYYEVYGNPLGTPAVVVHGGPGAGCFPNHARLFDPAHYRIILVDQRGCGRSTPYGCLADNTTGHLVADLEQLRRALGVQQWVMLGGSWGVTLTLAYAQAHPASVLGIILRGVCLMRPQEIQWMFGGGAAALKPLGWSHFLQPLTPEERTNPLLSYYRRLLSADGNTRSEAANRWSAWEMSVGFSAGQNVVVWDGQQWSEQATPAVPNAEQQQQKGGKLQQLPPPPRPMSQGALNAAAAAAAAAAAGGGGGLMPLLHRDVTGSSWFSSLQQQQQRDCTTTSTAACNINPSTTAQQQQHSIEGNNASPDSLQPQQRRRDGGNINSMGAPSSSAAAASASSSSSSSNISTDTFDGPGIQEQQQQQPPPAAAADVDVQQLIQQGLQHSGFGTQQSRAQALLEAHYSIHGAFLHQQPLLDHIDRLRHIPCIAVHGQWDLVCPPTTAVELGQAWPEMELRLVPRAGHSMYDPAITHELVTATDRMRVLRPVVAGEASSSTGALAVC